jgi:ribonuclease HI
MPATETLTIHTDGAARGNPGPAAFAYVIAHEGQTAIEEARCMGRATNNVAEYTALVEGLGHALKLGTRFHIAVHSDSELMVKQMKGEYKVKNEDLRPLYEEALQLARKFEGGVSYTHVRRGENKRADELCNEALDGKRSNGESTPSDSRRPEPKAVARPEKPLPQGLHAEALACLRDASGRWAKGDGPTPEIVWSQLTEMLRKHLVSQLTPPGT